MKQRTSVYLDDLDREAVRKVAEYYGITSDTDVLCFSVRSVARAITAIRARKPLRIIQGMKRRSLFGEGEGSAPRAFPF